MSAKTRIVPGQRYGRLEITGAAESAPDGHAMVACRCDCGGVKVVLLGSLRRGDTKSCGCLQKDATRAFALRHGDSSSPENRIWRGMRKRCLSPTEPAFPRYGGRGIFVCPEWSDYSRFLADMGRKPSPKHSLDRINNDGPYSKANCRWATRRQQMNNQSKNRILVIDGETHTLTEWSRKTGVGTSTIKWRLSNGWNLKAAVMNPAGCPK
jgi:hypothetical protein